MPSLPKVLLVGGPDVDARIDLMHRLKHTFEIGALGSHPTLRDKFISEGFIYYSYYLNRRMNPISDLVTIGQLVALFRKTKPQIIHTFDTKLNVWGRLAAKLAGVPIIIGTITGLGSTLGNGSLKSQLISWIYKQLQTIACRQSDLTIFQNHDDARLYIETGVISKQKTKIILGSGVSTDYFSPERFSETEKVQIRHELGIQSDAILVTMVSRVIRSKGVIEYAAAAKNISADHSKVRFLLIGQEDKENQDVLNSTELGELKQSVIWPGPKSNIAAVLASSDIFVLPTAYAEGIPRVLLEAASIGLPIITTQSPGCNEVVEDGVNGFLVPVGDGDALGKAILKLIQQPELRKRFGTVSRHQAITNFDLAVVTAQTRSAYQQLLANKSQ